MSSALDSWLRDNLVCPRDQSALRESRGRLECAHGHAYPIEDGVPVLLIDDVAQTIDFVNASVRRARGDIAGDPRAPHLYLESLGISEEEKAGVVELAKRTPAVDPVVSYLVAATNGMMYRDQIGVLDRYPIPEIRLPAGEGRSLLDVGCSWGRWSIAAARAGYQPVGIDPSLGAIMAARRVARQLGVAARFVVGDARFLPFREQAFDCVYSYSVLQHFSREDASRSFAEMMRVVRAGGQLKVQMPSRFGLRCLYHQARRGFADGTAFDVRYWSLPALTRLVGPRGRTSFEVDGFFGIGLQPSDAGLMSAPLKMVLRASETLRALSRVVRPLVWCADSVFVDVIRR